MDSAERPSSKRMIIFVQSVDRVVEERKVFFEVEEWCMQPEQSVTVCNWTDLYNSAKPDQRKIHEEKSTNQKQKHHKTSQNMKIDYLK